MEKTLSEQALIEIVKKRVKQGYDAQRSDSVIACKHWLEGWRALQQLADQTQSRTLDELDNRLKWSQFLSNWLQDLEQELWNTGIKNRQFLEERIVFCEDMLKRFPAAESPDLGTENLRRSLAETYFEIGDCEKAETLFSDWLKADPQWGWGWIGWSDLFYFHSKDKQSLEKSENILREGLAVSQVRDHYDILERLSDNYAEQGRQIESEALRGQADAESRRALTAHTMSSLLQQSPIGINVSRFQQSPAATSTSELASMMREHSPIATTQQRKKIGRNDACPCGSKKTYKKCCLKKLLKRM